MKFKYCLLGISSSLVKKSVEFGQGCGSCSLWGEEPGQSLCCEVGSEGVVLTGHPPRVDNLTLKASSATQYGPCAGGGDTGEEEERTLSPS